MISGLLAVWVLNSSSTWSLSMKVMLEMLPSSVCIDCRKALNSSIWASLALSAM